ncbi:hypothetical protein [Macrococcoides canis]|uniref:hypothetical protein n=1 Tax=Macrococcoides canis TaxID=1855823 RepID=UPI0020B6CF24|nr:hypothetical protein [Macrococcus canis]UTH00522.1 hypothetical protein KFV04_02335 [Macrococcus canis]
MQYEIPRNKPLESYTDEELQEIYKDYGQSPEDQAWINMEPVGMEAGSDLYDKLNPYDYNPDDFKEIE